MMPESIISKKGKGGYAFRSDRLVLFRNDVIVREIPYERIAHVRYSSKFNLIGVFWIIGQSPRIADVPPIRKNVVEIVMNDGRPSVTLRLAPHDFDRIREIINVPTKTDWQPMLDPGDVVYQSRHDAFSYALLILAVAALAILSVAAVVYDALYLFILGAVMSLFIYMWAAWIREGDRGRYSMDSNSISINSLFRSERMPYISIRSINIVHSKRSHGLPFVKCIVITFSKRFGRNIYNDAEVELTPRDAGSFISALETRLPHIEICTDDPFGA